MYIPSDIFRLLNKMGTFEVNRNKHKVPPPGSTGHRPVPAGDPPDGTGGAVRLAISAGGSPTKTGGSPVPPNIKAMRRNFQSGVRPSCPPLWAQLAPHRTARRPRLRVLAVSHRQWMFTGGICHLQSVPPSFFPLALHPFRFLLHTCHRAVGKLPSRSGARPDCEADVRLPSRGSAPIVKANQS